MRNVKGFIFGMVMMLIGAASGATVVRIMTIPKANDIEATMELSTAISMLDDSDMPMLAPLMTNQAAVDATNSMLGGEANCKAYISTYCTNDPAFAYRLIEYVEANK